MTEAYWAASDAWVMVRRSVRHSTRQLDALLLSVLLPVMLMLLFVYVLGGAIDAGAPGADVAYVDYVVPGIVLLCAGYGASLTAVGIAGDLANGVVDRFRSLPISRSSLLVGHVTASVARNLVSTLVVLGVAFAVGFRPSASALGWLGALAAVLLYIVALSWASLLVGLLVRSVEAAGAFSFFVLFLPYLSSAFVPTDTMPAALRAVAEHQPVTPMIETLRGLLLGAPLGNAPATAVAWFGAVAAASAVLAVAIFARRPRR